jgi:hypothetical protein
MRNALQYIVDNNGTKISVIVPYDKWEKINTEVNLLLYYQMHLSLYS